MQKNIVLFIQGGAGDVLCASPAVRSFRKAFPDDRIVVVSTYHALWENNPNVDVLHDLINPPDIYTRYCLPRENLRFYKKHFIYDHYLDEIGLASNYLPQFICNVYGTTYDGGPLDYVISPAETLCAKTFMSQFTKPVVLLHICGSIPSQSQPHKVHVHKDLDPKILEPLVAQYKEKLDFVQIGLIGEPLVSGAFDALGMPMREVMAIIPHCASFIFIESLFAHAANAFQKRGVVVFCNTDPKFFGHPNSVAVFAPECECKLWPCNRPLGALLDILPGYLNPKTRERPLWTCANQVCKKIPTAVIERALLDTLKSPAATLAEARAQ